MLYFRVRARFKKVVATRGLFEPTRRLIVNKLSSGIMNRQPKTAISPLRVAILRPSFRFRLFDTVSSPNVNGARRHLSTNSKKDEEPANKDGGPNDKDGRPDLGAFLKMLKVATVSALITIIAVSVMRDTSNNSHDLKRSTPVSLTKLAQHVVAEKVAKIVILSNETALATLKDGQTVLSASLAGVENFERLLGEIQHKAGVPPSRQVPVVATTAPRVTLESATSLAAFAVSFAFPFLLLLLLYRYASDEGLTRQLFKTKKPVAPSKVATKLADVAGLHHAKKEVAELALFLREPKRFAALGARTPKGALLVGPPGTGKTLIAKAIAGEAGCSFFAASGSEFLEMFVGMGAARIRRLFRAARAAAPAIVFIDEVDAVGGKRGERSLNDERERTLNQLLVEMDGFAESAGVIVLAGTNRADMLDRALLRPGRFDRRIALDLPDLGERREIFLVHLHPILVVSAETNPSSGAKEGEAAVEEGEAGAKEGEAEGAQRRTKEKLAGRLAALTPGFSGADIANVCNEGAIMAARGQKDGVVLADFEAALDRVLAGLQKSSGLLSARERSVVAHHEAGHAVAGWFLRHAAPLLKVTIQPRAGGTLGFAQLLPPEVAMHRAEQLADQMAVALGGRAAEKMFFGAVSTGAADDLQKVTRLAYSAVKVFGMSQRVGHLSFPERDEAAPRLYGDELAAAIDEEASSLVAAAFAKVAALLQEKKEAVARMAAELLARETLSHDDIVAVLGERPFKSFQYQAFLRGACTDAF